MRGRAAVAALAVLVAGSLAGAVSGADVEPWPRPKKQPIPLAAGTYAARQFFAPFRITLRSGGWQTFGASPRLVDLSRRGASGYVGFLAYGSGTTVGEVAQRLRQHPWLRTQPPAPARLGGAGGMRFDAEVRRSAATSRALVTTDRAFWVLEPGWRDRFYVVSVRGRIVTVDIQAPAADFELFVEEVEKELARLRFLA